MLIFVDQSYYTLHQMVLKRVSLNRWLILVFVMETNPKTVIGHCILFGDRLMSYNNQSKIYLNDWKQYKSNYRRYLKLMDKGVGMMTINNAEELSTFLISFQIYEIKKG